MEWLADFSTGISQRRIDRRIYRLEAVFALREGNESRWHVHLSTQFGWGCMGQQFEWHLGMSKDHRAIAVTLLTSTCAICALAA